MPRFSFLLAVLCTPLIVGCEGCRSDPAQKPSDGSVLSAQDFTAGIPMPYPSGESPIASGIKPGHWLTAAQSLKSNNADSRGDLNSLSDVVQRKSKWIDSQTLENGSMLTVRPVVMPKGQSRKFEYRTRVPNRFAGGNSKCFLSSRFVSSERSEFFATGASPFQTMGSAEYFMVVLTERPQRFTRFQVSDWAKPLRNEGEFATTVPLINYRIVVPPAAGVLPLAETMLDWTSTAVVFWDDLPPEALTPQQQTALADWVHYGGQLIVNGAAAANSIANTGLVDLLPLKPTSNIQLDTDAAVELLKGWQVPQDPSTEKQVALLKSQTSRVAVDGIAAADAESLADSGNLLLTRRAGSGRVLQSRFDLTSDWLMTWKSYDSFVNSVLLLRPPRRLEVKESGDELTKFYQQTYVLPDTELQAADPAINTRFRIAARDAYLPLDSRSWEGQSGAIASGYEPQIRVDAVSGIGGWSDTSDVIRLCRASLRAKSGIEIPDSSLVFRSLGCYLLILVPLNYLMFRIIGRLEYAWLAVPVIAIAGAVWVAHEARLDIGFARSQTELGLLEVQSGCDRAHLTRVVAIYNSLSSTYDIEFDTIDAAAMPIQQGGREAVSAVFRTGVAAGPILSGMVIGSNQVSMVHAEQMFSLGGTLTMDANGKLVNETDHELFDAFVVRRDLSGALEVANVGPCPRQSNKILRFRPATDEAIKETMSEEASELEMMLVATQVVPLGSTRLVAHISEPLPGMSITPSTTQATSKTVVLAHLEYAPWPVPKPDVNLRKENKPVLNDADLYPSAILEQ